MIIGNGKEKPTFIIANDFELSQKEILTIYAGLRHDLKRIDWLVIVSRSFQKKKKYKKAYEGFNRAIILRYTN